jgi:hypothetical protein
MKHMDISMENNISNFMLADGTISLSDELGRFLLKSCSGLICISQRKAIIFKQ